MLSKAETSVFRKTPPSALILQRLELHPPRAGLRPLWDPLAPGPRPSFTPGALGLWPGPARVDPRPPRSASCSRPQPQLGAGASSESRAGVALKVLAARSVGPEREAPSASGCSPAALCPRRRRRWPRPQGEAQTLRRAGNPAAEPRRARPEAAGAGRAAPLFCIFMRPGAPTRAAARGSLLSEGASRPAQEALADSGVGGAGEAGSRRRQPLSPWGEAGTRRGEGGAGAGVPQKNGAPAPSALQPYVSFFARLLST